MTQTAKKSDPLSDQEIKDLQVQLNRLYSQKAALKAKQTKTAKVKRMSRTRTLIQIGGLVQKSGLLEACGITEGDDLQGDIANLDKAATLLGILHEAMETIDLTDPSPFQKIGKRLLKT